jgi:two-component system, chemotaxis family, chemotaxis protein CheY
MGRTILIVDDSSIMRKMLKEVLRGGGHQIVGEAKGGEDAVALYRAIRPDIVTMDITMREMDGFAAARHIYAQDPKAKIIFLSNLNDEKYSDQAKQLGAAGYVNKNQSSAILSLIDGLR